MLKKSSLISLVRGVGLIALTFFLSGCEKFIVFNSKGPIGQKEAQLIIIAFVLMLIVVIPVFIMVFLFAWKYRASNKELDYKPEWVDSKKVEMVVWSIPIAIILVLGTLSWIYTHKLDPYKPLKHDLPALQVQVISTDWNWIFIYPEENIATINELIIQADRPVSFKLTSSTVMTSMFIPQLGHQMYAMAGMQTQLNLLAEEPGIYQGLNIEYSGTGYHTMHFKAIAKTADEFNAWLAEAKQSPDVLNRAKYDEISGQRIMNYPITTYSSVEPNLFLDVMAPYMEWMGHVGVHPEDYLESQGHSGHGHHHHAAPDMNHDSHSDHDMTHEDHSGHDMHTMDTDTLNINK
ncbi:MAG: ubiquinol oxidase subunit II [Porphyromonadaceae bacterium]|nr:ubiquinol oxidase subunit II [Porphyromonadaceae bacterium]